jgi:hypothetical protein
MKHLVVILIVAIVCGAGGYVYGVRTAPKPWLQEREKLNKMRVALAKRTRAYREIIRESQPTASKMLSLTRPTTRRATTRRAPVARTTTTRTAPAAKPAPKG